MTVSMIVLATLLLFLLGIVQIAHAGLFGRLAPAPPATTHASGFPRWRCPFTASRVGRRFLRTEHLSCARTDFMAPSRPRWP